MWKIIIIFLFIALFFPVYACSDTIRIGYIDVIYDMEYKNEPGIKIIAHDIHVDGHKGESIHFGVNIKQDKWLSRSWTETKIEKVIYESAFWESIWFFYSYKYLREKGDKNNNYRGYFHVVDKDNNTLKNKYFSFDYNPFPVNKIEKKTKWLKVIPVAGIMGYDIFIAPFADDNPEDDEYYDFMGGNNAYDGHRGTDFCIPSFTEMDIGVPVVSVADGLVIDVDDGHFDRNTERGDRAGNYVVIKHAYNRISTYDHLKKNSVMVKKNQRVSAGEQIGQVGSSGNSRWPHLHFEISENGQTINPFTGPKNNIKSRWIHQPQYTYPVTIVDGGLYKQSDSLPHSHSRLTHVNAGDSKGLKFWLFIVGQKAGHKRTWKLFDPSGTIKKQWSYELESNYNISNPWWWIDNVSYFPGNWFVKIYHDDDISAVFQFDVFNSNTNFSNRKPNLPLSIKLEPLYPKTGDVVVCRVSIAEMNIDPDLDRVRFHYQWILDGKVRRDIISASHADYFPAGLLKPGSKLVCKVYATDGKLPGKAVSAEIIY